MPSPVVHRANEGIISTDAATWRLMRAESEHPSTQQAERRRVVRLDKKQNASAGRAPPGKASELVVGRRLCLRWAKRYAYPGSMHPSPVEGQNITTCPGVSRITEKGRQEKIFLPIWL